MKKKTRKIMTVLLSVLIIAAFMPVMSFADETVNEAALTSEQIAAAQEITVGGADIALPSQSASPAVFKFSAARTADYGIVGGDDDFTVKIYSSDGAFLKSGSSDWDDTTQFHGVKIKNLFVEGATYYIAVSGNSEPANGTFRLVKMTKAIIQTNGRGTVYSTNYANGDKSKLKKVDVISGESGTFVFTAIPKDNYAFAGVYISGKSVKVDVYDINAFSVDYPSSKAGKTIVVKFKKVSSKAKKAKKAKVEKINATVKTGSCKISWKSSQKMSGYMLQIKSGDRGTGSYTTGTSYTDKELNFKKGRKCTIRIWGVKKVDGTTVFTKCYVKTVIVK